MAKAKSKSRSHSSKHRPEKHRAKPKQQSLPGMENRGIQELEDAAEEYVSVRDRRMRLTEEEVEAKGQVLFLMRKHERTVYRHDEFLISIVPGEDGVKVKLVEDSQVVAPKGEDVAKKKGKKANRIGKKTPIRPPAGDPPETEQEQESESESEMEERAEAAAE